MENVTDPDAILIADLQEQLDASRRNEEGLIEQLQQRDSAVATLEKQLSSEKILSEKKDFALRRFQKTESVNKKLTSEVQTLQHKVAVLTGKNTSTSKRLEEQKQLLKQKDAEKDKLTDQFEKLKKLLEYYKEEAKKLPTYEENAARDQKKLAELRKEIENHTKQNQIQYDNIGCLKRQNKSLQSDKKKLELSEVEMSSQIGKIQKNIDELKSKIEVHKDEAFKYRNIIKRLQCNELIGKTVKRKLVKNAEETMQHVKDQDQKITDLKAEIRNHTDEQADLKIKITVLKSERDFTLENLSKAQREIGLLKTTVEKQQQDILARTLNENQVSTELVQKEKDYESACNQLIEVSRKLENTQVLQDKFKDNAEKEQKLEEKKYRVTVTEKEGLERELQHSVLQASQQRHTITLQKAAKDALAQKVRSLRQEVRSLTLQNMELGSVKGRLTEALKKVLRQKVVLVAEKSRFYECNHALFKHRQRSQRERCVQRQAALVKRQREEIEELKLTVARRPDDANLKLVQCQWEIRDLKKQLMAFQGEKTVYDSSNRLLKEENRKLSEALSGMKVEAWQKHKAEPQREPQRPSRQTRFPVSADRTPSQAEDRSSRVAVSADRTPSQAEDRSGFVPVLHPLTRRTQLCVGKFMPRPPPSLSPKHTPDLRLPEIEVRRLLPSRATPVPKKIYAAEVQGWHR